MLGRCVVSFSVVAVAVLVFHAHPMATGAVARRCQRLDAATLTAARFHALVRSSEPAVLVGAGTLPELRAATALWGGAGAGGSAARARSAAHVRELLARHGDTALRVSLSPSTEFEGVEPAADWPGAPQFWRTWRGGGKRGREEEVLSAVGPRLQPCGAANARCVRHVLDRVVVRPAATRGTLRQLLEGEGDGEGFVWPRAWSGARGAYVQYEQVPPALLAGARPTGPAFAAALRPEFQGLWLGRGTTRAQLHHDANENLLLVLRGSKRWRLFPPAAGEALHEGYMLEVQQELCHGSEGGEGEGEGLCKGTVGLRNASMSFFTSPVALDRLDAARFPRAAALLRSGGMTECTLRAGDMLYVPSWWWHQVDTEPSSSPLTTTTATQQSDDSGWSAALNFWFEPYFVKPFGCAACPLRRNGAVYGESALP